MNSSTSSQRRLCTVAFTFSLVFGASASAQPLTLDQAIDGALQKNPDIASARLEVEAAEASRAAALSSFGPRIRTEGNLLRWNDAVRLEIPLPAGIPTEPEPIVVREQTTASLSITAAQPITPLWSLFESYKLRDLGLDIARVRAEVGRRDLAFQVTEAFFRVLQAEKLAEIQTTSVAQVEAQVKKATAFAEQGVLGRNDVLRAELAGAATRQRAIAARGNAALARARLAMLIGLDLTAPIVPVAEGVDEPPAVPPIDEVEQAALRQRGELRELDHRIGQAQAGSRAAWSRLLPQISATASYQLNRGQGFVQEQAYFVGGALQWDVWDWGATYFGAREAEARARQASSAVNKVRDGIRLDVKASHVALETSVEALAVARRSVEQAEENFRLETRRYEANANTTFDVLDAEALLTQARGQYQTALFDAFIAAAGLRRAAGVIGTGRTEVSQGVTP